MKRNYVKAVIDLLLSGHEVSDVLKGLKNTLTKRNHNKLYLSILKSVSRELGKKLLRNNSMLVVAQKNDEKTLKKTIEEAALKLGLSQKPFVQVDETLIGGFILTANNKEVDQSYKTKLISLYRNVTKELI